MTNDKAFVDAAEPKPAKRPKGRQTTGYITFRTLPRLRENISAAAAENSRSVSEEVTSRLEDSFANEFFIRFLRGQGIALDMLRFIDEAVKSALASARTLEYSEAETREAVRAAVEVVTATYTWTPGTVVPCEPTRTAGKVRKAFTPQEQGFKAARATMYLRGAWDGEQATTGAPKMTDNLDKAPLDPLWTREPVR